ncbi:asparagine synthetase B family protein [Thalassospira mesophila]|uniref:asparagine synthase (glutamine-hydrolyzing) n=1 Tax=Thalassospira mesophila TaxID=1293891 RepID=A0A1Y2KZW4_9PROT|nr:asparagine synthase-related protein [Thalassospira mesophila]OSQ38385.1 hypothetical protein TMES_11060 [Thalassospira mesophila]
MCGLIGATTRAARSWGLNAARDLAHRGPDGWGIWPAGDGEKAFSGQHPDTATNDKAGPVLLHRRLATTDTSPQARQPVISRDGRFVLIFNGYIAGYKRMRAQLDRAALRAEQAAHTAQVARTVTGGAATATGADPVAVKDHDQSRSDTDVLLALLGRVVSGCDEKYGDRAGPALAQMLAGVAGAYAFALWDNHRSALWLGVDAMGQKPVYFARRADGHLFFASELAPLLSAPGLDVAPDAGARDMVRRHLFVPAPQTPWHGISQLQPGHIMCWQHGNIARYGLPTVRACAGGVSQSAQVPAVRQPGTDNAASGGGDRQRETVVRASLDDENSPAADRAVLNRPSDVVGRLRRHVYRAVADAMTCDRPVACLLSGGMDSAGVAAMAARVARHRARRADMPVAAVMGFAGQPMDETMRARQLASHLQMPLKIIPAPHDPEDLLTRLRAGLKAFGGPFGNPAMILTHCLSQSVADIAPVCLTGDGGDEVFGGYRRYQMAQRAEKWLRAPAFMRRYASYVANGSVRTLPVQPGQHLAGIAKFLAATTGDRGDVLRAWNNRCVITRTRPGHGELAGMPSFDAIPDLARAMMQFDLDVNLPGNQLAMSDRMGMAFGVEYRPPLLDRAVRKAAASIPAKDHLAGAGKAVWRQAVSPFVPAGYLDVAKAGFNPPVGQWMHDIAVLLWGDEKTAQNRMFEDMPVHAATRQKLWQRALGNDFDAALTLWNLLVWQVWQMYDGSSAQTP